MQLPSPVFRCSHTYIDCLISTGSTKINYMNKSSPVITLVSKGKNCESGKLNKAASDQKMASMLCSLDFLAAAASFQLCKELNANASNTEDETNTPNSTINETESSHCTIPMRDVKAEGYTLPPISEIIDEKRVQIIKEVSYPNDLRSKQYSQNFNGYTNITSISPIRPSSRIKTAGDPQNQSKTPMLSLINETGKAVSNSLSHNVDLKIVRYSGREGPYQRRKRLNQNYKYRETLMAQGIYPLHRPDSTCACSRCGETFRKEMLMWRHGVKHLDGKPFRCDICYSRFNRSDTLARHVHCFHELPN